jgi:hypothetical protein
MNDADAQRIIRLLEEIRDGQQLQLERQAQALERQAEVIAQQRQRLATLSQGASDIQGVGEHAGRVVAESAKLVKSARLLIWIALPFVGLLLAFLIWALFTQVTTPTAAP